MSFGRGIYTALPRWRYRTIVKAFGISDLSVTPTRAYPGETIYIAFSATNSSHSTSIYTVALKINGRIVAADIVSLPPRSALPMSIPITADNPGFYRIDVNDQASSYIVYRKNNIDTVPAHSGRGAKITRRASGKRMTVITGMEHSPNLSPKTGRVQSSVDRTADVIETGLDKIGDALVFPIVLLVNGINSLRQIAEDNRRRR